MLRHYHDLLALTDEPPKWYDDNGTPRWCEFHPDRLGIYDDLAIFYRILCQDCGTPFLVASSQSAMDRMRNQWMFGDKWTDAEKEERIKPSIERFVQHIHYGDPPNHGCVGDTMNCEDVELLEAWERYTDPKVLSEWRRHPELEGILPDGEEALGRTV